MHQVVHPTRLPGLRVWYSLGAQLVQRTCRRVGRPQPPAYLEDDSPRAADTACLHHLLVVVVQKRIEELAPAVLLVVLTNERLCHPGAGW